MTTIDQFSNIELNNTDSKNKYLESIIKHDDIIFETYYAHPEMFDYRHKAIELALLHKNDYAKQKLCEFYPGSMKHFCDHTNNK